MFTKIVSAAIIVSTLGLSTAAFAAPGMGANQDTGFLVTVDQADRTITLSGGATYQLPYGYDVNSLNEGQKVAVTWDQIGGSALAQSVSFTN
jgi:hypothetical protein